MLFPTWANFVYLELGDRTDGIYVELERRGVVTRPFAGEGIRVTIDTGRKRSIPRCRGHQLAAGLNLRVRPPRSGRVARA